MAWPNAAAEMPTARIATRIRKERFRAGEVRTLTSWNAAAGWIAARHAESTTEGRSSPDLPVERDGVPGVLPHDASYECREPGESARLGSDLFVVGRDYWK